MADTGSNPMRRRAFIQNGAAATVAATALTQAASVAQDNNPATPKPHEIPKRMLGKTGVEVTILNGGTARAPAPSTGCCASNTAVASASSTRPHPMEPRRHSRNGSRPCRRFVARSFSPPRMGSRGPAT